MLRCVVGQQAIITLTSDFGRVDSYVAAMKAVMLGITPAHLIDVSHDVPPQDVADAAYLLETLWPACPPPTVHLAVVDPGVGTARRPIAVQTPHGTFVGPDNGLFVPALTSMYVMEAGTGRLAAEAVAVELTERKYRREEVSTTFHGRDIFAPAAAWLAAGTSIQDMGPRLESLVLLHGARPHADNRALYGTVRHIDHFGNLITNIPATYLPAHPTVEIAGRRIEGLSRSYQEREVSALVGSTGYLEIAVRDGSAAQLLCLCRGAPVVVRS